MPTKLVTGIQVGIVVIAVVLSVIAWGRLVYVAAANPSPWRALDAVVAGQSDDDAFICFNGAFIVDDTFYRTCNTGNLYILRMDLKQGVAETVGPPRMVDFYAREYLVGFAPNEAGDILALIETFRRASNEQDQYYLDPDQYEIWRASGAVESLGLPPDITDDGESDRFAGAAWVGDEIQVVVTADYEPDNVATLHRYVPDDGWQPEETIARPAVCDDVRCDFGFAWYTPDGWQFLYMIKGDDEQRVIIADADGNDTPAPLTGYNQFHEDGEPEVYLYWDEFDTSRANIKTPTSGNAYLFVPFMRDGAGWTALDPQNALAEFPGLIASAYSYYTQDDQLHLIYHAVDAGLPRASSFVEVAPQNADVFFIDGRWLVVERTGDDLTIRDLGDSDAHTLLKADGLGHPERYWTGNQLVLAPASDGGYWLLAGRGGYIHLDAQLNRTDPLTLPQRVKRVFDNFELLGRRAAEDWYFRENITLKKVSFVVILLLMPLAGLFAAFRRWRKKEDYFAWLELAAWVYIPVFILGVSWFWHMTAIF